MFTNDTTIKEIRMATVEEKATFNTSVGEAFDTIANLGQWPQWIPPITNISNIAGSGVGTTYDWEFKLGALPKLSGTGEVTQFASNELLEVQTQGVPSTWLFKFSDDGGKALISASIQYDIPGGKLASKLVSKQIEESLGLLRGLLE